MKTFFHRLVVPSALRRKRVVVPALTVLGLLIVGGLWILGHSGANSVWNQPSVPISDVLDGVDRGEFVTASISGQRILLTDAAGRQSWTIEKDVSMGSTEQYLRSHGVKVAVQSTDETSFIGPPEPGGAAGAAGAALRLVTPIQPAGKSDGGDDQAPR